MGGRVVLWLEKVRILNLTSETVQSTALSLEGVYYIHSSDGLPLGMLGVGNGITDDILQEYLQDTSGFFVDKSRDTLDTTTSSQTTDSGLGDTLDIITKNFAMPLGSSLSQTFSTLAAASHLDAYDVKNTSRLANRRFGSLYIASSGAQR